MPLARSMLLGVLTMLAAAHDTLAQQRVMQPADLFRIEQIGAITWAPDRHSAAVEMPRPGRWLDASLPTAAIAVVDVASATLRTISPASRAFVGFFGAAWSPHSRRLLFLSVDSSGVVRPWLWQRDAKAPVLLPSLELHDGTADPPLVLWRDSTHAVFLVRDSTSPRNGPLSFKVTRGRNVADAWARAREERVPAVSVLDSRSPLAAAIATSDVAMGASRLVAVDVRSRTVTTLARGPIHRPSISSDGRTLTFRREHPPLAAATVATFFGPDARGDDVYDAANWGTETHHIDARTGAPVPAPDPVPPRAAPAPTPMLRVLNSETDGTSLVLGRPGQPDVELWHGNRWTRAISRGRVEAIRYTATTGAALTGWLLYPPGSAPGQQIPVVTMVYPGTLYGPRIPPKFSALHPDFEHPQLFAALGYGVVLPSMPARDTLSEVGGLAWLTAGVLPLLDTLVARGIADSSRIAILGQSAGGYAALGLLGHTSRFRTAIASASYANLVSLYGTFYGPYRHGDAGDPQRAQVLRMLQLERGFDGMGAPPWEAPERYRANSPIGRVAHMNTPLMLIHGEADFIPIQQAEEVFTALYRQDKRVRLVRYAGEHHTIAARANVLDLWRRLDEWLQETMPRR